MLTNMFASTSLASACIKSTATHSLTHVNVGIAFEPNSYTVSSDS